MKLKILYGSWKKIDEAVRRIIDNGNYIGAFEVMNYIFVLIGDVDMDDSDGGTSMLADRVTSFG